MHRNARRTSRQGDAIKRGDNMDTANNCITCTFTPSGTDEQALQALKAQLEQDGYSVQYGDGLFSVAYSRDALEKRRTRGAGRKTKDTGKSCRDVFLYRQDHSQKETAAWLEVNFRTYQRIEKSIKDARFWEDSQAAADTAFMRMDTKF